MKALPYRVARKAGDVATADRRYLTYDLKKSHFFTYVVPAFLKAENPCTTLQFM